MAGGADVIVAGGTESMSLVPMGGHKVSPNPTLVDDYPDVYLTHRASSPRTTRAKPAITREEQDAFALRSHQRAVAAIDAGRFTDEIVPVPVPASTAGPGDGPARPSRSTPTKARAATPRSRRSAKLQAGVPRRRAPSPPATRRR